MAESLGREEVLHIASLARLGLSEEEVTVFAEQLSAVLGHVDALRQLDLKDLPPMHHPLPLENVLREDEPGPTLSRDEVLAAAPEAEAGAFRVPRILAEEP
jgi:aspartyl-tRNA(Asn)/glutamyl-tRNA(Gln) amidotransferase subunit C